MKILLIQPARERGLGFRSLAIVEPLGLESIAGSLLYPRTFLDFQLG